MKSIPTIPLLHLQGNASGKIRRRAKPTPGRLPRLRFGGALAVAVVLGSLFAGPIADAATARAKRVIGQKNFFTRNPANGPAPGLPFNAKSLNGPGGVAVSPVTGKLFVADYFNSRVTRYGVASGLRNGAAAEDSVPTSLNSGWSIFVDKKDSLWIADNGAGTVVRYSNASSVNLAAAVPAFTFRARNCQYLWVDTAGTLWISFRKSRSVSWIDKAGNFTTNVPGKVTSIPFDGTIRLSSKAQPEGVAVLRRGGSTFLWVADVKSHRVLRFDNPQNGQAEGDAAAILGQPNADSRKRRRNAAGLSYPRSLFVDQKGHLWVADTTNNNANKGANRILRWNNAASLPTGARATALVGQPNPFTKRSGTTRKLIAPFRGGICLDTTGKLWLADDLNNRVLRFKRFHRLRP